MGARPCEGVYLSCFRYVFPDVLGEGGELMGIFTGLQHSAGSSVDCKTPPTWVCTHEQMGVFGKEHE